MADYRAQARDFARRYGLDPNVFVRQIRQESGFNPHAVSPAGARGIAQFMPGTAAGLGVNPDHPTQALKAAAKLMASYVRKYGSYRDALVAYNAGPGRVGHSLPAETQNYIATILGGSNPSTARVHGGSLGGGSTTTRTSTTSITPEAAAGQRAALAQFVLSNRPDPVSLAQNYAALGQQTQTTTKVRTTSAGAVAPSGGPGAHGGYAYPLARRGKIIGTPYSGTHTLGNWQSDNAVDIAVPVGTGVRAVEDGVVVKITPHPEDGGRFAGDQVTIRGAHGGTFYTHLSAYTVKVGQRVRKGQQIGRSGSANGVAHLHIGRERGNPQHEFA